MTYRVTKIDWLIDWWRPPAARCCIRSVRRLFASPPSAWDFIDSLYVLYSFWSVIHPCQNIWHSFFLLKYLSVDNDPRQSTHTQTDRQADGEREGERDVQHVVSEWTAVITQRKTLWSIDVSLDAGLRGFVGGQLNATVRSFVMWPTAISLIRLIHGTATTGEVVTVVYTDVNLHLWDSDAQI